MDTRSGKPPYLEPGSLEANKLEVLSAMDILRNLPESDIEALMSRAPMRTARIGTTFFGADDGPEVLFLLESGRVELCCFSPEGKKLTLDIVEDGTILGEMSLISQRLVGTFASALEDRVICALSRRDVETPMLEHPRVAFRIIGVLAQRLRQTRDFLQGMTFSDVTSRAASLLLRLEDKETKVIRGYSHQDLASMVGCLRESFTAILDRFKKSGALKTGRKRIEITDHASLSRWSARGLIASLEGYRMSFEDVS